MTREELKEHCEKQMEMCELWAISRDEEPSGKIYEKHKLILELLEQQPSEDCISRQAVNVLIDELARAISDERCCVSRGRSTATIMRDILHLPSVTPRQELGHWIEERNDYGEITCWHCDKCYENSGFTTTCKWDFCPNCGTQMESE